MAILFLSHSEVMISAFVSAPDAGALEIVC